MFPKALEEDAKVFCEKAKKYDLILVPGDTFGVPGYFRLAYCIGTPVWFIGNQENVVAVLLFLRPHNFCQFFE